MSAGESVQNARDSFNPVDLTRLEGGIKASVLVSFRGSLELKITMDVPENQGMKRS